MVAFGVIVRQVLTDHMLQGAFAEKNELLHAFRLDGLHEPLRKRIQVRGLRRKFHDRDTGGVQDLVEGLSVFGVASVNQIAGSAKFSLPASHIPGDLLHPRFVRILAHSAENDPTGSHVDEKQRVISRQSTARPNLCREEIRCPQHFPVPTNEIAPCRIPSSLRRWPKAVSLEDVAHRLIADVVPQIVDRASNSVVAPRRIVSGQTDDQVFDFGFGRWSSVPLTKSRTIKLLGHQSPVPFEDRLRFDDGDPVRAPLIRLGFEKYATGLYTKQAVLDMVTTEGLLTRRGRMLANQEFDRILANPLYTSGSVLAHGRPLNSGISLRLSIRKLSIASKRF